jgi:hypothetical protein
MPPADGRSRLFHAIVAVGAALGSACGGATVAQRESESLDASNDDAGRDSGRMDAEIAVEVPGNPVAPDAAADAGPGVDAAIAADGGFCTVPGSDGRPCQVLLDAAPVSGCCLATGCFPCFV